MQQITVIHTADLHLGFRQYGFPAREGDFYNVVAQLFKRAVDMGADAILIAGDTFDSTKPPSFAVRVLKELTEAVKRQGVRVLAIDGNHDVADGNWMEVCGIEPIGGRIVTITSKDGSNTLRLAGIDSCRPATFCNVLETLKAEAAGVPVPVLAIHQAVSELSDFATQDYSAMQIAGWVAPLGVQYVAMGDIHGYRETVIGGVRFAYCGSAEMKAVDENPDKSASVIFYDGVSVRTSIIPLQTRPFLVCNLASQADLDSLLDKVNKCQMWPLVVAWYAAEAVDIAKRAESILKSQGCMYRFIPLARSSDKDGAGKTFNRADGMIQLKDAVEAYFDTGTDEYELVFQLLNSPDNVKETVAAYMKTKGL